MRVIKITTYPSMPDRFRVEWDEPGKRGAGRDARNAGEAAAAAMTYASAASRYVILGHDDALKQIPAEIRSKL